MFRKELSHPMPNQEIAPTTPTPKKRSFLRIAAFTILFSAVISVALVAFGYQWLLDWSIRAKPLANPIEVDLAKGASLSSLSKALADQGLITHGKAFHVWTRYFGAFDRFQAGHYRFENSASPQDIAGVMRRGETYNPVVFQITVPEGASLKQISERLAIGGIGSLDEILKKSQDTKFLEMLRVPSKSLEGFLYPSTYPFSVLPSAEDVFTLMVQRFWNVLPPDYEVKVGEHGLSLLQAVTFASLIELETANDEERSMVAEVIWNRLKRGLPLGIDAAIIYGIKEYQGDITWKHLKDATNPYNLRIHGGLPPSPVASPSLKSLLAVLSPSELGYLYYVVDAQDSERHRFAKTLAEHNRNVNAYVKSIKRRKEE